LLASSAAAADPKVEAATKVFQSMSADAQKVKTFCEMTKTMDGAHAYRLSSG
jgi:hypothetical protein